MRVETNVGPRFGQHRAGMTPDRGHGNKDEARPRRARALAAIVVTAAALLPFATYAEQVTETITVPAGQTIQKDVMCSNGKSPLRIDVIPAHPSSVTNLGSTMIDSQHHPIDFNNLGGRLDNGSGGYTVKLQNLSSADETVQVVIECEMAAIFASTISSQTVVGPGAVGVVTSFCPSGLFAFGAPNNTDFIHLREFVNAPVFGSPTAPVYLDQLPDGPIGAPVGWQVWAQNVTATSTQMLHQFTWCGNIPGLSGNVFTAPTVPGTQFGIWAPVADDATFVGFGYDSGATARPSFVDFWASPGVVPSALPFVPGGSTQVTTDEIIRAFFMIGYDTRPKSESAPKLGSVASVVVLTTPKAAPPAPTIVTVVEFYNAGLDHYFITAIPKEISDLDNGVHPGWQRTQQSFKAYDIGSTGHTGRRPVCREYGNPAAGLDSHFYSANPNECYATLSKFTNAWLLESSEVFQMDLPDTTTGACPAGDVPIYRVWNNRADSNHRYTSSRAIRDQMVAKGYIAEGYGPDNVTLCGLP